MNIWADNEVQFARVLCEIKAAIKVEAMEELILALAVSMDFGTERVEELFERAEQTWEAAVVAKGGGRLELS